MKMKNGDTRYAYFVYRHQLDTFAVASLESPEWLIFVKKKKNQSRLSRGQVQSGQDIKTRRKNTFNSILSTI